MRRALVELTGRGLVTNDRFDPLRAGDRPDALGPGRGLARPRRRADRCGSGRGARSPASPRAAGRAWIPPPADPEARLLAWAGALLERYGVLSREVVALEPSAPAWGELAPLLARAEWRGELRRGYFVEGLSGVQYATEEAAAELARLAAQPEPGSPVVLVSTLDPANLYGAGAPLDVELLDGGVGPAAADRRAISWRSGDGRPVLIIESYGKRLTGLPWASPADIDSALKLLPSLTGPGRRILKVESYNGEPAAESPSAGRLAELGFVRDYPGMAYYAGWAASAAGSP